MNFTVHRMPQGSNSPEWLAVRLGRLTGSVAGHVLAKIKSGEAASRRDLRTRMVCERLTGMVQDDTYVSEAMQWGTDKEAEARIAYEMATGRMVQETGFLACDGLMAGCSLDGDVDNFRGIVEIKCPFKTARHIETVRGSIPSEYVPQLRHNLWVSGAEWCDYISYDPRLPEGLRLVVHRLLASDADLPAYEREARKFLEEVDTELAALRTLADTGAALRASQE
jgi:predicted phage-related endonuclease